MPLHLLGKKSWNVYNTENIARVQRDEAAAKARDERNENDQRTAESSSRLQVLRGEELSSLPSKAIQEKLNLPSGQSSRDLARKKRKLAGEDDTDRDVRLARISIQASSVEQRDPAKARSDVHSQHVADTQQRNDTKARPGQNEELTGMRFKDATGYRSDGKPWYSHGEPHDTFNHQIGKDVWGNEDPRRHEREQRRLVTNDPLLAIKQGVKRLKEHEKERREWREQREKDLYEVERLAQERLGTAEQRNSDESSLEDFSLDVSASGIASKRHKSKHRDHENRNRHHRHHHRSRSQERKHHSHRNRSRSREREHHSHPHRRSKPDNESRNSGSNR